jgi:acetyl-CoA C-acetyltransferase
MRKVAIIGIGETPVGEQWGKSLREIAGEAVFSALLDANRENVDGLFIGNMLSGMLSKQENIGSLISDWVGIRGVEAIKIEAACGSGAAAFRTALFAVSSGELESAVAVGVEKMTETKGTETTLSLATAADADYEIIQGLSFVAINALVMKRYMHQFGWRHTDFANFSINSHENAKSNPYARLRSTIRLDDYANARMLADPINLLDASPIGDGAAAILIVPLDPLDISKKHVNRPLIVVEGSSSATDTIAVHDRKNPIWLSAAEKSALEAYRQAGVEPENINFFEVHDAFSIMAALSLEACGFIEKGQGPRLAIEEEIKINGKIPISTKGGLKARGHPVGATGVYQLVEATQQLRGEAGETQVQGAMIGMTQNIGGSGATVITHILKRVD